MLDAIITYLNKQKSEKFNSKASLMFPRKKNGKTLLISK